MRRCPLFLCLALVSLPGCVAARNRADRCVTCVENASAAAAGGLAKGLVEGMVNVVVNLPFHAIFGDDCDDEIDLFEDESNSSPPTTGIVSDEYSQWKD